MLSTTRVRLVALDLDGTLIGADFVLRPRGPYAVAAAQSRGVAVTIVTGRMFAAARPFARALAVDGPIVCYQGAAIFDAASGAMLRRRHAVRRADQSVLESLHRARARRAGRGAVAARRIRRAADHQDRARRRSRPLLAAPGRAARAARRPRVPHAQPRRLRRGRRSSGEQRRSARVCGAAPRRAARRDARNRRRVERRAAAGRRRGRRRDGLGAARVARARRSRRRGRRARRRRGSPRAVRAVKTAAQRRRKASALARIKPFWIFAIILAGLIAWGGAWLAQSPWFRVTRVGIEVPLASPVSRDTVRAAAGISRDANVWLINTRAAARRVEAIPYVDGAEIRRGQFPKPFVELAITVRRPTACVSGGDDGDVTIDGTARVLQAGCAAAALPRIEAGKAAVPAPGGTRGDQ